MTARRRAVLLALGLSVATAALARLPEPAKERFQRGTRKGAPTETRQVKPGTDHGFAPGKTA